MTLKRNSGIALAVPVALLGIVLSAGSVSAESAKQIQILCASNWPENPEEQRLCRERQTAAADELLDRIEASSETSLEFAIAKACIERGKIRPPSTIHWTKALTCFENRLAGTLMSDDP